MKKIIYFLASLCIIGIISYVAYTVYYPTMVAEAVVNKKYIKLLPKKYNQKLSVISDTVNSKIDKVISSTEEGGISIDQLEAAILEVKKSDVELIYFKLKNTEIISVEQVYDTIAANIELKSLDVKSLRAPFLQHVKKAHIKKGLKYIEMHDLFNTIDENSARQIATEILKQKKVKIQQKLEQVD